MTADADFLIVGAGLAGAATAYHLRRLAQAGGGEAGCPPRVVILEKEAVAGVHSSGRNAALLRFYSEDPLVADLTARGAEGMLRDGLTELRRTGSFLIGLGEERAEERFPLATGCGRWCPEDGVLDVAGLLAAYLRDQDVRYGTAVLGWKDDSGVGRVIDPTDPRGAQHRRGRVDDPTYRAAGGVASDASPLRVRTTGGDFTTRVLVNAAGAWAGALGRIPLTPTNRHLFVTPPMPGVGPDWPYVWNLPQGLYFRPESGGLLLCACDETPAKPGCYDEDPRVTARLEELLRTHQPGLGELRLMRTWVGQRTFAPDRRFVIGFDPRDPRLFHVAGLGGNGVATSYAIGEMAAGMLLSANALDDNPFDPRRLLSST